MQRPADELVKAHRHFFARGLTRDIAFRKGQLIKLRQVIDHYELSIMDALHRDLGKSPFEAYETEIGIVRSEINYMLCHLDRLAAPKRVPTPLTHFPSVSRIHSEPYGVVLIMSPWNYPFQLTIAPLVGAIAAGNCAVVKPSAYSPATSRLLRQMLGEIYPPYYVSITEGGREVNRALLDQKYDYIFFTGSAAVGQVVMEAAAKNLTPLTLELGGKSPCIVDETADIPLAARRIAWGKFLNAGQTCVAPDYVLVHHTKKAQLTEEIWRSVQAFYGIDAHRCAEYPKIVNHRHFERLLGLMEGEAIIFGGHSDIASRKIEPTLLHDASWNSPAMQEEIFGPLLPILSFDTWDDVVKALAGRPKPLALYLFTRSRANRDRVIRDIPFGGGCINDTVVHLATPHMPFGGLGESGMGGYHGRASFETFSHRKSVLEKATWIDLPVRYPPFNKTKYTVMKQVMKLS